MINLFYDFGVWLSCKVLFVTCAYIKIFFPVLTLYVSVFFFIVDYVV